MNNKIIVINNLSKSFKDKKDTDLVINKLSFDVNEGEFLSIVGTSGCGKTTLLNIISGLDISYDGIIYYNINKDKIEYMLQDSALFPWLSLEENASIGCKIKKIKNEDYIQSLIRKYGLENYKKKKPSKLSGGMKQRVSLIRSISTKPKLLLLDEPFAALDYQTRIKISDDVYKLAKENNITVILITHDISEAVSLADRVLVLSNKPTAIKKEFMINFDDINTPSKRRENELFSHYYKLISGELDIYDKI